MKLVFQHLRDTQNIGDRWCSPFDWFDWQDDATVKDIRTDGEPYDVSVLGGGKIFGGISQFKGVQGTSKALHIAWGVSTVQSFPISLKYHRAKKLCALIGTRDWNDKRYTWAPCTSCMAPQFDTVPDPDHDVVFYYHGGKTERQGIKIPSEIPTLSNNAPSLDAALSFIASGRTVVSNSYHGVYWGLLMGRRVLCVPFSNKFHGYRLSPGYATPKTWLRQIETAQAQPQMLDLCRKATLNFKNLVTTTIAAQIGEYE